jgi:hypothetical protein
VSRLCESGDQATHQAGGSTLEGGQSFVPTQGASGPEPLAEDESPSYQDSPTIPAPIHYASKAGSAQPVNEDPNDQTLSDDAIVGNSSERDDLCPAIDARAEFRLHTSDFIQSLSE